MGQRGHGRVFRRSYKDATGKVRHVKTWTLEYSIGGHQYRESAVTSDRREAVVTLRQRLVDRGTGRLVGNPLRVTLNEIFEALRKHYIAEGHKSLIRINGAIKHLEGFFLPGVRALDVSRSRVAQYVAGRIKEGCARDTVRYEISVLNSAYSNAAQIELLTNRPGFRLPPPSPPRKKFFEVDEFTKLLQALIPALRQMVMALYLTGWRSTEIRLLSWKEIDFEGKEIVLDATRSKSGESRSFPFSAAPELRMLLEARHDVREGAYVFHQGNGRPFGVSGFRYYWEKACKAAGLDGKTPHDLRRTVARESRRLKIDEATVMRLQGWKSAEVFRRYSITDNSDAIEATKVRFNSLNPGQRSDGPEKA